MHGWNRISWTASELKLTLVVSSWYSLIMLRVMFIWNCWKIIHSLTDFYCICSYFHILITMCNQPLWVGDSSCQKHCTCNIVSLVITREHCAIIYFNKILTIINENYWNTIFGISFYIFLIQCNKSTQCAYKYIVSFANESSLHCHSNG